MEVTEIRVYEIRGLKAAAFCYSFRGDKLLAAIIPNSKIDKVRKVQQEKASD